MALPPLEHLSCDVAIIGAGGAGLRAAAIAAEGGLSVLCLSKVPPTRSHTVAAQGGINAALGNRLPDDWEWHMYDTIRGSDWLGDQDVIAHMCEQAPAAIIELEHLGMPFTRDEEGQIYQRAYGGQYQNYGQGGPAYRACAVADRTGHSLLHTLYGQAVRNGVRFMVESVALDLLIDANGACHGVLVWELESGKLYALQARRTILACGGYGQAWEATTSSSICTGDGGGMVLRAGLPMQDMEFVQHHPTSLYGTGILVTEGSRGEGGVLRNGLDERFMAGYAAKSMELASRDIIARAMATEIILGRGAGPKKDHLLLDLTHLPPGVLDEKLPSVKEIARTFARIDAATQYIPVLPAVHYTMGGIPGTLACEVVDGDERAVPGLMAIGEAASASVHGANRLGCNGLLDLVIYGKEAALSCLKAIRPGSEMPLLPSGVTDAPLARLNNFLSRKGTTPAKQFRKELQHVMRQHAGIFRTEELLGEGEKQLRSIWQAFHSELRMGDTSLMWNNELAEAYETDSLLRQALATVVSARARTESRGAHWREDYPERDDDAWLAHSLVWIGEDGKTQLGKRGVRMLTMLDGTPRFPPDARSY